MITKAEALVKLQNKNLSEEETNILFKNLIKLGKKSIERVIDSIDRRLQILTARKEDIIRESKIDTIAEILSFTTERPAHFNLTASRLNWQNIDFTSESVENLIDKLKVRNL